jgi:hypothetical protein
MEMSLHKTLIQALASEAAKNEKPSEPAIADDLVRGAGGIAMFLFGSDAVKARRKVYHLANEARADRLPVFRMGQQLFARKSTLTKWIAAREGGVAGERSV